MCACFPRFVLWALSANSRYMFGVLVAEAAKMKQFATADHPSGAVQAKHIFSKPLVNTLTGAVDGGEFTPSPSLGYY